MSDNKEHFIADQNWRLLTDFDNPKRWIDRLTVRSTPIPTVATKADAEEAIVWKSVDRHDVARNQVLLEGQPIDLTRFCFTTDAGMGKTVAIEWMWAATNHPALSRSVSRPSGSTGEQQMPDGNQPSYDDRSSDAEPGWLAFNVPHALLTEGSAGSINERLYAELCEKIKSYIGGSDHSHELPAVILERHRQTGRLLLLFDGLDHLGSVDALSNILNSELWQACSIGLGGRQFSLNNHWQELFALDKRWKFIQVMPLTEEQQKVYLSPEVWNQVNPEARHLLCIPRVIKYIKKLSDDGEDVARLRTASDVFHGAIETLIIQGLNESLEARKILAESAVPETASQGMIEMCFRMLSAIAFEMVCDNNLKAIKDESGQPTGEYVSAPNFQRVRKGGPMTSFREQVATRNRLEDFDTRWNAISSLSIGVLNALFDRRDPSVKGLTEIQFSNRGFQEFLCAYYLGHYCGLDEHQQIAAATNDFLWDWIYLPLEPDTHHYYEIWKYLAEMPRVAIHPPVWLESMAPVYSPARLPDETNGDYDQRVTKRSNEIIFRSWHRLEELIEGYLRAFEIRETWWSEFEKRVVTGDYGEQARSEATSLVDDFINFPAGKFWMGQPAGKPYLAKFELDYWSDLLDPANTEDADSLSLSELADVALDKMKFEAANSVEAKKIRDSYRETVLEVLSTKNLEAVETRFGTRGDTAWTELSVGTFGLSRKACPNSWFRLYGPNHGTQELIRERYRLVSGTAKYSVVFVSFFDAWAFCKWARWDKKSCRLPWEKEWEYACKYSRVFADSSASDEEIQEASGKNFWWGEEFKESLANAESGMAKFAEPDPNHANPETQHADIDPLGIGVLDIVGNPWEWCHDVYEPDNKRMQDETYESRHGDGPSRKPRSVRGGAFSFGGVRWGQCRYQWAPEIAFAKIGFRIAR